ncbi:hypothetical protein BV898_14595 [Hypsibius exemplaris]|uniref:Uncharacterized protein n=1 Tax=Hypsibius exemplaris TaxID=2072580 RepID=A0A9X6N970_HYPEX|nr:hypothetical protein BV898_14595 [Hypsibius exemplaris]
MAFLLISTAIFVALSANSRQFGANGAAVVNFYPSAGGSSSSSSSGMMMMPDPMMKQPDPMMQQQTSVGQGYVCANGQCYYDTNTMTNGMSPVYIRLQSDYMGGMKKDAK